jgi:hypothetical protein
VALPFPAHVTAGEPVQFVVDQRIQLVERGLVSIAPFGEQLGDLVLLWCSFQSSATSCLELRDLARLSQHLVHFTNVEFFFRNHASGIFVE